MTWWGKKSDPVIICYQCRKRISREELSEGLHDHDSEQRPEPVVSALEYAGL